MANPPFDPQATPRQLISPQVPSSWPSHGLGPCQIVQRQLPALGELPAGSWIGVVSGVSSPKGWAARLFSRQAGEPQVHLAVRCMALKLAGYEQICAANGIAFGRVPRSGG